IYYLIPYTSFTPTPTYSLPSDSTASFITSSLNNSIFNTFPPSFEKVLIISFFTSKDVLYLSSISKYTRLYNLPSCILNIYPIPSTAYPKNATFSVYPCYVSSSFFHTKYLFVLSLLNTTSPKLLNENASAANIVFPLSLHFFNRPLFS